jgi:mannose-1-phosphate guanylyltransferase
MSTLRRSGDRWSIVLAGGDGVRLRPYVQHRFGELRPKQYCNFFGARSMLEHTLDRAASLASEARTVTIVAAAHERWSRSMFAGRGGTLVSQTLNRETGPGVYLPLAYVRKRDPEAVVYILPSDHYVHPAERFVAAVTEVGDLAARDRGRIVLTGVAPESADGEYGYIEPGEAIDRLGLVRRVRGFVEKPAPAVAAAAIARGAVWNTMVIAASVEALWDAGRASIPAVIALFDELVEAIDTPREAAVLASIYERMPVANFSRDVLEQEAARCVVARLDGIEWSDWGQAERIEATIARHGARRPPLAVHHGGSPAAGQVAL